MSSIAWYTIHVKGSSRKAPNPCLKPGGCGGLKPYPVIVTENESMWQVADTGWIYVVGDTNRAGKALLTLLVDDLEDHVAELGERGLATGAIDTVPGLYRKAVIIDPEGNMISLGEDLSTGA